MKIRLFGRRDEPARDYCFRVHHVEKNAKGFQNPEAYVVTARNEMEARSQFLGRFVNRRITHVDQM
jgi:hypothetical protein